MTLPNFLIIGVAKAGTTSLYHYLKQHPQIYMSPVKEPRFFGMGDGPPHPAYRGGYAPGTVTSRAAYEALFKGVVGEYAIGEATPSYLWWPKAAQQICTQLPDARLIACLRQPADRAYSSFLTCVRAGLEPCTNFARALREEEKRFAANANPSLFYTQRGLYYPQIKRYFDLFPRQQIRIYLYDDFS
jgi:hypothetical protein